MPKTARTLLVCVVFALAASVTVSAAAQAKYQGDNPAFVSFRLAPKKIVCLGEKADLQVHYEWNENSGVEPLAPLYPLVPKGRKQPTLEPPGNLTLNGDLAGQIVSMGVGYGPGTLFATYTAKTKGNETLKATLTYGPYKETSTRVFDIKECTYNLVIKAWNDVKVDNTVITSYFSAEGKISIGEDGTVTGELREDAWFDISSDEKVLSCELLPLPMARGTLTVSGTRAANGSGAETVSLTISYGAVSGFPKSVGLTCTDKIKNKPVPTKKYQLPPSNSPGDYLLSQLVFSGGGSLTGTFGKGGHSDYILEKLQ